MHPLSSTRLVRATLPVLMLAGLAGLARAAESTVELAYKARITPWLTVQPDVQIVLDPHGDSRRGNVVILGFRTVVDF